MFKLIVSNGLDIETTDYKTEEEAKDALKKFYESLGEEEDSSWLSDTSAFHQGYEEANSLLIEKIPDDIKQMSAEEILAKMDEKEKESLLSLLEEELGWEKER